MSDPSFDGIPCAHCDEGTVTARGEHDEWPEPCDHCGGRGECDCAECHAAWEECHCANCGAQLEDDGWCPDCVPPLLAACEAACPEGWWDLPAIGGACHLRCDEPDVGVAVQPHHDRFLAAYSAPGSVNIQLVRDTVAEALVELRRRVTVDPWPWVEPSRPVALDPVPRPVEHEAARIFADALERSDDFTISEAS